MSSLARSARRTAGQARHSTPLVALTRGGFVGYGLLHLAVAWLALQIALGHPTEEGDQSGAFQILLRQPFGRPLVIIVVVGLVAMALWQLLEAAIGHRDEHGTHRVLERLASLARTVIYGALAWTAWKVQSGTPTSSASQQKDATAGMLAHSSGRALVAVAGLVVIAVGAGLIVYGAKRSFEKRLRIAQMSGRTRHTATRLGQVGYIAKGLAFGIVGILLFSAAVKNDPARSAGLDGALRTLAGQPLGKLLLIVIAVGFAAFGVYCFFQSKYRKV
ncbi:MAG TPA: DUF1206 domain-containing protein [Rugosimonospora sp.]